MSADPTLVAELVRALAEQLATPARITLRPDEAAAALGVSRDHFDLHIGPELRWIRRGRLKLVAVDELRRWAEQNSAMTLATRARPGRG